MKRTNSVAIGILAAAALSLHAEFVRNPDANTLWREDGKNIATGTDATKGWRTGDFTVSANPDQGFHFAQKDGNKDKSTGRYVPTDPAYPYLVLDIPSAEFNKGYISLNTPAGMLQLGKIEPGYFVVDLYNLPGGKAAKYNKVQYFAFYLYNCKVNFNELKVVKSPAYFATAEITPDAAGNIAGAKAIFRVRLQNPAESVSLQLLDNRGMTPLAIDGAPSLTMTKADADGKEWIAEVAKLTLAAKREIKAGNLLLKATPVGKDLPPAIWSSLPWQYLPSTDPAAAVAPAAKKKLTSEPARSTAFAGPYALESADFLLDHTGGPLALKLTAEHPAPTYGEDSRAALTPSLLATLYDPQDNAVKDFYWRDDSGALTKSFDFALPDAAPGLWQLRVAVAKGTRMSYNLQTTPARKIAIMPNRCWIWHRDLLNFPSSYFMVPADNRNDCELFGTNAKAEILDLDGKTVAVADNNSQKVKLTPGAVYQLKLSAPNPNWAWVGIGGFPVILCQDIEQARKLNAGRIDRGDGTLAPLRFQQKLEAWKKTLKPADLAVPVVDLRTLEAKFQADKTGAAALLGLADALAGAEYLLSIQNVDPSSPDFGSATGDLGALALLYSIDKPYNPYYKNKALANRIALYFLNLLAKQRPLQENGTLYETSSNYAGADAMYTHQDCNAFMLVAPDLPADVREMWEQALAYPLRRFYSDRVSCENQSAHWPMKLYALYKGSGKELYKQLAENFVKDLANPAHDRFIRTGYLQESYGADATYQGLCTSVLAFYFHLSGDPAAKQLLDRIYSFMNHTVAPEPDGSVLGASGFAHRTLGSWAGKQYAGGTRLMSGELDSAASWHRQPDAPWSDAKLHTQLEWIATQAMATYKTKPYLAANYAFAPFASAWHTFPPIAVRPDAKFPAESAEEFDRDFNGEFRFVRRGAYYAGAYTNPTAGKHVSWGKNRTPFGCKWKEVEPGVFSPETRAIFSALPGLQLVWTPKFGMVLQSMNWNLYTHQTARLEKDGKPDWVSYWDTKSSYDPAAKRLTFTQKYLESAVSVTRDITFAPDALQISLNVVPAAADPAITVTEQLPYPVKPGVSLQYQINGTWGATPAAQTSAIRFVNAAGAGAEIAFSRPVTVQSGSQYRDQGVTIGTIDALLGNLTEPVAFQYSIKEIPR